jgi:hypothetical protein
LCVIFVIRTQSCGLSDEVLRELREVETFFRLPSVGLVEKDLYVGMITGISLGFGIEGTFDKLVSAAPYEAYNRHTLYAAVSDERR